MMKKTFLILLFSCMLLLLTACGKGDARETTPASTRYGTEAGTSVGEEKPSADVNPSVSETTKNTDTDSTETDSGSETEPTEDSEPSTEPEITGALPVLYITTENGAAITSKETYVNATMKLIVPEDSTYSEAQLYDGDMEIRGRGNSTWMTAKKPYKIKLDKKTDLLGMGKSKHWVLLANYYDTTLMRNSLAFDTAKTMGFLTMDCVHVEVYLNGEYQGNYQLCEQIRVANDRVEIHDWEHAAEDLAEALCAEEPTLLGRDGDVEDQLVENLSWLSTGTLTFEDVTYDLTPYTGDYPSLTGGFLLELDDTFDEISQFRTESGQPIMVKSPEYANTNDALFIYIQAYVQAVEDAITSPTFTTLWAGQEVHYSELIDVDSFVDFFLLTEVFANLDSMFKSTFLYKDIDGKLTMGPLWDFDLCAGGSMVIEWTEYHDKWQTTYRSLSTAQGSQWYRSLIKDPAFLQKVLERYQELRETAFTQLLAEGGMIDAYETLLAQSGQANFELWNNNSSWGQGGWGNGWGGGWGDWSDTTSTTDSYTTKVQELRDWLEKRLAWLDARMTDLETLTNSITNETYSSGMGWY